MVHSLIPTLITNQPSAYSLGDSGFSTQPTIRSSPFRPSPTSDVSNLKQFHLINPFDTFTLANYLRAIIEFEFSIVWRKSAQ